MKIFLMLTALSCLLTACEPCDDNDLCTVDVDQPFVGCLFYPVPCDDAEPCTNDYCINGICEHAPVNCDDANACTTDTCVNTCHYSLIPGCTGPFAGCTDDGDPCTDHTIFNHEVYCNYPLPCDDGQPCTDDFCIDGTCNHQQLDCNDGDPCTDDFCSGSCVNEPITNCL